MLWTEEGLGEGGRLKEKPAQRACCAMVQGKNHVRRLEGKNHQGNKRVDKENGNITLCIAAPF